MWPYPTSTPQDGCPSDTMRVFSPVKQLSMSGDTLIPFCVFFLARADVDRDAKDQARLSEGMLLAFLTQLPLEPHLAAVLLRWRLFVAPDNKDDGVPASCAALAPGHDRFSAHAFIGSRR